MTRPTTSLVQVGEWLMAALEVAVTSATAKLLFSTQTSRNRPLRITVRHIPNRNLDRHRGVSVSSRTCSTGCVSQRQALLPFAWRPFASTLVFFVLAVFQTRAQCGPRRWGSRREARTQGNEQAIARSASAE